VKLKTVTFLSDSATGARGHASIKNLRGVIAALVHLLPAQHAGSVCYSASHPSQPSRVDRPPAAPTRAKFPRLRQIPPDILRWPRSTRRELIGTQKLQRRASVDQELLTDRMGDDAHCFAAQTQVGAELGGKCFGCETGAEIPSESVVDRRAGIWTVYLTMTRMSSS